MTSPTASSQRQDLAATLYWKGRGFLERQDWRLAASAFRQAVRATPHDGELRRLLGLSLARMDRFEEAIAAFRHAIACAPEHARAHGDLGVTLLKLDRLGEAIAALETALAYDPQLMQARLCLGMALSRSGAPDRALAILEPAVRLSPDPEVHAARAWAMLAQGQVEASIAALRRTLLLNPRHPVAQFNLLFALQHLPGIDAAALHAAHCEWAASAGPPPPDVLAPAPAPPCAKKAGALPVLGIVSGDLRRHAVGVLTLRAFEALQARGFRIVCFASQCEDDDFSQRYRSASAAWHRVDAMGDAELGALIQAEGIDILFDLAGMTARNRMALFARRAAPFQISWAGYTGTTGLAAMDALIADAREVPQGEDRYYTEQVLRLPDCYVCFEPPDDAPEPGKLPMLTTGTVRFGCFQRAPKLNRRMMGLWAAIATRVPGGRFVLRYGCYVEGQTQEVVRTMARDAGLDEALLVFEPGGPNRHMLDGYRGIDIALDTVPYSGGVTTLEALWMGVPVVSRRGDSFAGRHGASHLHAAGLPGLIADSDEAYVAIAAGLAADPAALTALRADLRARVAASPLMDAPRFAENLETAILAASGW